MDHKNWNGFVGGAWQSEINVRDFIQTNYREYTGDDSFLARRHSGVSDTTEWHPLVCDMHNRIVHTRTARRSVPKHILSTLLVAKEV